jgi:hypothetical protein
MNDKKTRLTKYVETLRQRLSSTVPKKFEHRPQVFKDMISLDIRKTLAKIERL